MNGLPYYKAYPRDFIEGTIGMPFEMKCAYRVVLDLIYMQGGDLPDDARYIAGLLGCSVRKWGGIRDFLIASDKVQVNGEFLTNYRAVSELESLAKLQDRQRENRSGCNKNKGLEKPRSRQPEPEPEPYKKEVGKPTSVHSPQDFQDFWDAYPHRDGKKKNRSGAEAAFSKAIKAGADLQSIAAGVEAMQCDPDVARGFARDPTTWLNQRGWTDEIPEAPRMKFGGTDEQHHANRPADQHRGPSGFSQAGGRGSDASIASIVARRRIARGQ